MRKHAVIAGRAGQFYRIEEITAAAFCRAGADASISLSAGDARSCDLLVVPGGFNDVNPALYGMPNTTSHEVTPEMDELQ